jgi:hypothetical protein
MLEKPCVEWVQERLKQRPVEPQDSAQYKNDSNINDIKDQSRVPPSEFFQVSCDASKKNGGPHRQISRSMQLA